MKKLANWIVGRVAEIPTDRVRHFAVGAAVAAFMLFVLMALGAAAWVALILSFAAVMAVELYKDYKLDTEADILDVVATVLGGCTVWATVLLTLIAQR